MKTNKVRLVNSPVLLVGTLLMVLMSLATASHGADCTLSEPASNWPEQGGWQMTNTVRLSDSNSRWSGFHRIEKRASGWFTFGPEYVGNTLGGIVSVYHTNNTNLSMDFKVKDFGYNTSTGNNWAVEKNVVTLPR